MSRSIKKALFLFSLSLMIGCEENSLLKEENSFNLQNVQVDCPFNPYFWTYCMRPVVHNLQVIMEGHIARGDIKEIFTIDEIDRLNTEVAGFETITKSLIESLMKFKAALIGGEVDSINKLDLEHSLVFLNGIESLTQNMRRHVNLIFFSDLEFFSPRLSKLFKNTKVMNEKILFLKTDMEAIINFVIEMRKDTEANNPKSYSLSDLKSLLNHGMGSVVQTVGEEGVSSSSFLYFNEDLMDFLFSFIYWMMNFPKSQFFGSGETNDWYSLVDQVIRLIFIQARINYIKKIVKDYMKKIVKDGGSVNETEEREEVEELVHYQTVSKITKELYEVFNDIRLIFNFALNRRKKVLEESRFTTEEVLHRFLKVRGQEKSFTTDTEKVTEIRDQLSFFSQAFLTSSANSDEVGGGVSETSSQDQAELDTWLESSHLDSFHQQIQGWYYLQVKINGKFSPNEDASNEGAVEEDTIATLDSGSDSDLDSNSVKVFFEGILKEQGKKDKDSKKQLLMKQLLIKGSKEMLDILNLKATSRLDGKEFSLATLSDGRLNFGQGAGYSLRDLFLLNSIRAIVSSFVHMNKRALYSDLELEIEESISLSECDLKALFLNKSDSNKADCPNWGKKRLQFLELFLSEGSLEIFYKRFFPFFDLFMPGSDGNGEMSLKEGTQYLFYFSSSYSWMIFFKKNFESCVKGNHFKRSCFWDKLKEESSKSDNDGSLFSPMGGLRSFIQRPNEDNCENNCEDRYRIFVRHLENVVRSVNLENASSSSGGNETCDKNEGGEDCMSSLEVVGVFMIFHYLETFLARFDENGDGFIEAHELWDSLPVFTRLISQNIQNINWSSQEGRRLGQIKELNSYYLSLDDLFFWAPVLANVSQFGTRFFLKHVLRRVECWAQHAQSWFQSSNDGLEQEVSCGNKLSRLDLVQVLSQIF